MTINQVQFVSDLASEGRNTFVASDPKWCVRAWKAATAGGIPESLIRDIEDIVSPTLRKHPDLITDAIRFPRQIPPGLPLGNQRVFWV